MSGHTPLHSAARWNKNPDVIKSLVTAGADTDASCKRGMKPVDRFKYNAHLKDHKPTQKLLTP